jgi:hypothetical protein
MVGTKVKYLVVVLLTILNGCSSNMDSEVDLLTSFDFESGSQQWEGGYSDFPVDYADSINFKMNTDYVENAFAMADAIEGLSSGINVQADNPHGDLFYYFTRKIFGLSANTVYQLDFEFLVYAQLVDKPEKLSSNELYLKLGAVNYEPQLEEVVWRNNLQYKTLNVKKGELNSDGGADMLNVGSIKDFTSEVPEIISGNTFDTNFEVKSNADGEIWILVGADSGIRSQLTFGMEALTVYYRDKN